MRTKNTLYCQRPDRDISALICGHPLPCPWHTVVIDTQPTPPTITIPATAAPQINRKMIGLLKEIARGIDPKSIKKRRIRRDGTPQEGEQ